MATADATEMRRRPDFFCIGMQKAGTTWLHENLKLSDGFFSSLIKEPHFFDNRWVWSRFSKGDADFFREHSRMEIQRQLLESIDWSFRDLRRYLEEDQEAARFQLGWITALIGARNEILTERWYAHQFALCPDDRKTGDFTPDYYLLPEEGIQELLRGYPLAKFLLLVRDPVERDWSALRMQCASDDAEQLLGLYESPEYQIRADYQGIIGRWRSLVPQSRFMTAFFDEISAAPVSLLNRISEYLEIPSPAGGWLHATSKVHQGRSAAPPERVLNAMVTRNQAALSFLADEFGGYAIEWKRRYS